MFCFTLKVEFFGPLCDLVEGSLEVDVGGLEISDRVEVPSLAELCVCSIHTARLRCMCMFCSNSLLVTITLKWQP